MGHGDSLLIAESNYILPTSFGRFGCASAVTSIHRRGGSSDVLPRTPFRGSQSEEPLLFHKDERAVSAGEKVEEKGKQPRKIACGGAVREYNGMHASASCFGPHREVESGGRDGLRRKLL